jgi:hypothetical protein
MTTLTQCLLALTREQHCAQNPARMKTMFEFRGRDDQNAAAVNRAHPRGCQGRAAQWWRWRPPLPRSLTHQCRGLQPSCRQLLHYQLQGSQEILALTLYIPTWFDHSSWQLARSTAERRDGPQLQTVNGCQATNRVQRTSTRNRAAI